MNKSVYLLYELVRLIDFKESYRIRMGCTFTAGFSREKIVLFVRIKFIC